MRDAHRDSTPATPARSPAGSPRTPSCAVAAADTRTGLGGVEPSLVAIYRDLRSRHSFSSYRRTFGRLQATWPAIEAFRHARRELVRRTAPPRPLDRRYHRTVEEQRAHLEAWDAWEAWAVAHRDALTYEERDAVDNTLRRRATERPATSEAA
jgi:hypothetical protein